MNLSSSVSVFLILGLLSLSVLAEQNVIPVFPQGSIDEQETINGGEHAFLLSTPKRINNALSIERQQRVTGDRHNIRIRVSDASSSEQAFNFYQRYFAEHGTVLYQCEQYDCGSSNYWANTIFKERTLYGRDNHQYYLAGKVTQGGEDYWLSVYSVMNGRRQNYVYLSYVLAAAESASPAALSLAQWRSGYLLEGNEPNAQEIRFLSEQLAADPALVVWVAAFASSAEDNSFVSRLMAESERAAYSLRASLLARLAVTDERVKTMALGPFAQQSPGQPGFLLFLLYP